jgi:hypothetical protein
LLNCAELPPTAAPGPTTVTLSATTLVDVVIVASNLVSAGGDAAMIDDIHIEYTPCASSGRTKLPTNVRRTGGPIPKTQPKTNAGDQSLLTETCRQLPCDFEEDLCAYEDMAKAGVDDFEKQFTIQSGRFENVITGIDGPSQGDKYAAVYLRGGERAALTTIVTLIDPVVISLDRYVATTGMIMRGCCDSPDDCPFETSGHALPTDRDWIPANFTCPSGTTQVTLICDNIETSQGACGIDNIRVLAIAKDDDDDVKSLC